MILSSEVTATDAQQMLEFYKQRFAVVEIVSCGKCQSILAFECFGGDGMGLTENELGKYIIPIGDNLLSHRVRLDEAPTGERMVGYQCGVLLPNPDYAPAMEKYQEELAIYNTKFDKELAAYDKQFKKDQAAAKKAGGSIGYAPPDRVPPLPPNIPEKVECGNDTRVGDIERGHVPVGPMQVSLSPFEKHQIRQKISADKSHKPNFKKVGNIKHFESFQVERV